MTENRTQPHDGESRRADAPPRPDRPAEERSFLEKGAGAAEADASAEVAPTAAERKVNAPHAKPARHSLGPEEKPDQLATKEKEAEDRQEALIDEGVEESFPASDPPSVKRIT